MSGTVTLHVRTCKVGPSRLLHIIPLPVPIAVTNLSAIGSAVLEIRERPSHVARALGVTYMYRNGPIIGRRD